MRGQPGAVHTAKRPKQKKRYNYSVEANIEFRECYYVLYSCFKLIGTNRIWIQYEVPCLFMVLLTNHVPSAFLWGVHISQACLWSATSTRPSECARRYLQELIRIRSAHLTNPTISSFISQVFVLFMRNEAYEQLQIVYLVTMSLDDPLLVAQKGTGHIHEPGITALFSLPRANPQSVVALQSELSLQHYGD